MDKYDHVAFQVSSMDAAIQFYVEKLDFTLFSRAVNQDELEEYVFLTFGNLRLELIQDLSESACKKPSIERPYGPKPIGVPSLIYTHGGPGEGLTGGDPTEVVFVRLEKNR